MSRILLLSTYELGVRPLGCTVPAAVLAQAGHEVRCTDLAVQAWPTEAVLAAEGVVLSVPMHTALRLGSSVLARLRAERPDVPVFLHGLYAHAAANAAREGFHDSDEAATGEIAERLVSWADRLASGGTPGPAVRSHDLGPARPRLRPPQLRAALPSLSSYARLQRGEENLLVGTLETTTGCNHRCRHCPVPVVYGGRTRPVALETILAEASSLIDEGAQHLHIADPDFLNRPAHALGFARALAAAHPGVSFDATIKVSHLLAHGDALAELARCGLVFVTSALESTSDLVLAHLDKGHDLVGGRAAIRLLRRSGIEPRPSFLPFTPWTTAQDLIDLLDFVAEEDLIWNVDAVQYGIRLLLPPGSLLLEDPDPVLKAALASEDPLLGGTTWKAADPTLDRCQARVAALAEELAAANATPPEAYLRIREAVFDELGRSDPGAPATKGIEGPPGPLRPRLSESWFCCAEPTSAQRAGINLGSACRPRQLEADGSRPTGGSTTSSMSSG
jgi:radical SAM superfamily enzyme YgiQ (UPF0313 family)